MREESKKRTEATAGHERPTTSAFTQKDINRQLRSWPPRRVASWALMGFAFVVAAQHILAHGGFRPIPVSMDLQDLFFGFPMAILIFVLGAILIDSKPRI